MKFGAKLGESTNEDWRFYYLDYDGLKALLKKSTSEHKFQDQDEAAFVETLERELEKVASFRQIKADELARRVEHCENLVKQILESGASTAEKDEQLAEVRQDVDKITAEVAELSRFTRVNYTGFLKILKKHDKHTSFQLKPMFLVRMSSRPFYKEGMDALIIRLSKIFDTVRTGHQDPQLQNGVYGTPRPGKVQSNFVRKTTKYWVHPDNVTEVKCIILKYLPVLLVNGKTGGEHNPAVSSVYFDNESFELYGARTERKDGSEAIRFRWYGNMDQNEIFVERKTHHDESSPDTSMKSRFAIKEKYVNEYIRGDYSPARLVQKARGVRTESELHELETLASSIQHTILEKNLKPVLRTFYNRTAFQLPGDSKVRISLDTDLTFIREDNEGRVRSGKNWRRTDCGTTHPFDYLPKEDYNSFPYAVLEVKIETKDGGSPPVWLDQLLNSHLLEEVQSFSKFVHGVSVLLDGRISLFPFWLSQLEKSLLSPATALAPTLMPDPSNGSISRGTTPKKSRVSMRSIADTTSDEITVVVDRGSNGRQATLTKRVGSSSGVSRGTDERTPLLGSGMADQTPARPHHSDGSWWSWWASSSGPTSGATGATVPPRAPVPTSTTFLGPDGKPLPPNKRIALPVRIEPKVFFANERTFLSWLHFCIVLGGLAVTLVNVGDRVGQISGLLFTLVAMLFMIYSLFLYQWRAQQIRDRHPGPYDDRVGPTVLVVVLFAAVAINFYLKFSTDNKIF